MPDYDAFGREIGDDPLAALRASVNPAPPPAKPKPEPPPQPEAVIAEPDPPAPVVAPPTPEPAPQFVRPQRRRRRGGLARLLVLLAIVAGIGIVGNSAVEKGGDIIQRITPEEAPPPAAGVRGASLIQQENFAAAIKTLSAAHLGRPLSMRVAPDRIDATLVKGDKLHQVQITPDGELRELGSGGAPAVNTAVPYARIDTAAPERLTRAGATRKQPARSIDYVVLISSRPITWSAIYKRGRQVIGDAHGHLQRVL